MKRLVTLTATLLALTAVPLALASGGLGKFKTTLTGKGAEHRARTARRHLDHRPQQPHLRPPQPNRQRRAEGRRKVSDLRLHDHPHPKTPRQVHHKSHVHIHAHREQAHVHAAQGHMRRPQRRPHLRPLEADRVKPTLMRRDAGLAASAIRNSLRRATPRAPYGWSRSRTCRRSGRPRRPVRRAIRTRAPGRRRSR